MLYYYYLSIIIILLIILNNNKFKLNKNVFNTINFLKKKDVKNIIFSYLNKLNLFELQHKTKVYNKNNFFLKNIYFNRIIEFNNSEKKILKSIVKSINKKLQINFKWNIVKCINIEFNFPFTLHNTIFLPNILAQNLKNNFKFRELLLHEQLHIIQRFNKKYFNNIYIKKYKLIKSKIIFNNLILKHKISNPDGMSNWIFKENNKYYFPIMLYLKKKINTNFCIEVIHLKNNIFQIFNNKLYKIKNFKFSKKFKIYKSLYHPNELFVDNYLLLIKEKLI